MEFDKTINSFNDDSSLQKTFMNSYLRNTVPNKINEQNVKKCFELLNLTSEECPMKKLYTVLKPLFVNFEWLTIQKIIDLLDFFYKVSLKQFELFRKNDFKIEM